MNLVRLVSLCEGENKVKERILSSPICEASVSCEGPFYQQSWMRASP